MSGRSRPNPSLDGGRSEAEAFLAKLKADGEIRKIRRAVKHPKVSRCPSAKPFFHIYSSGTNKAYELPCGKWTCNVCGWGKQRVAEYLVLSGMLEAHKRGEKVRFLTLTEDPKRPMQIKELSAAWNRLRSTLKHLGKLEEYAAVVEATKRGRPHLHVVCTGDYVPQRELSRLAEQAGFGRISDIRLVDFGDQEEGSKKAASYIAKELSGYMSKTKGAEIGKLVKTRRRPVRTSRGWYPGGMERVKRELREKGLAKMGEEPDEGDFFFVFTRDDGTLRIQGRTPTGEPFVLIDDPAEKGPVERSQVPRSEAGRKETSVSSETHPPRRHKRRQESEKRAGPPGARASSKHDKRRTRLRRARG